MWYDYQCIKFISTENADKLPGFELMYVAVSGGTHICGGSTIGRNFLLESHSHVPYSFVGYVATNSGMYSCICTVSILMLLCAESPTITNYADRMIDSLCKEVQDVFNGLYSEFINIATVAFRHASLCISTLLNMFVNKKICVLIV